VNPNPHTPNTGKQHNLSLSHPHDPSSISPPSTTSNPLFSDAQEDDVSTSEDKIDELNIVEDPQQQDESEEEAADGDRSDRTWVSGYFFNRLSEAITHQEGVQPVLDRRVGRRSLRV
jgi:hypothetical protein